ncbi:hypothetical protein BpHYR1_053260 [Brachionus plicatilis]|uniref:Uncharacterized protein n=1 Tax=Brachionus plicatilis TaxID=10195 RepID=A0A3M7T1D4_BRAPC|nr:hypothetical protein BpHYR1_053260 [Brachionus plicatilis]
MLDILFKLNFLCQKCFQVFIRTGLIVALNKSLLCKLFVSDVRDEITNQEKKMCVVFFSLFEIYFGEKKFLWFHNNKFVIEKAQIARSKF